MILQIEIIKFRDRLENGNVFYRVYYHLLVECETWLIIWKTYLTVVWSCKMYLPSNSTELDNVFHPFGADYINNTYTMGT